MQVMKRKVLCFGDSILQHVAMEDSLEFEYHVESFPGKLAQDLHFDLTTALEEAKYDVVVLCAGVNDLGHGRLPQDVVDSLLELHKICTHHKCGIIAVYLHYPMFEHFNELYDEQSDANVRFCTFFYNAVVDDFEDDAFHLSAAGQDHFANCIHEMVECPSDDDGTQQIIRAPRYKNYKKRKFNKNVTTAKTLYTYIFPRVLIDYTAGCAISRASSKENAIQILLKAFDREKAMPRKDKKMLACRMGTRPYSKLQFETNLRAECAVMNDTVPFAFFVGGGST